MHHSPWLLPSSFSLYFAISAAPAATTTSLWNSSISAIFSLVLSSRWLCPSKPPYAPWFVVDLSFYEIISRNFRRLRRRRMRNLQSSAFSAILLLILSSRGLCPLKSPCTSWAVVDLSFYHIISCHFRRTCRRIRHLPQFFRYFYHLGCSAP